MSSHWRKSLLHPIKAALVIVSLTFGATLAGCTGLATSESIDAYVDDASIATKVKAVILNDSSLKVFQIHVVT